MATLLRLPGGIDDLTEIVEGLLAGADARADTAPEIAARWRTLAHDIGDSLDLLPPPKH
ncbi:hypothetical protein OHB41_21140 [Streptomyces sp. NBC_01571]|uniref:hypothetical protein n=1 Tax=Streptomyces sp. NBC_01571 TaxID=2975883 RepID=UPI0022507F8D|nr:hypothetical protein [Streptomyces sp. NBC_01571]MCX4575650.1 hypothetical protein [Streptomyces sp. NBC_01571]